MNEDELAALCERVFNERPKIRLHCGEGHFIVAVTFGTFPWEGRDMLAMAPGIGRQHDPTRLVANPRPEDLAGTPDWVVSMGPRGRMVVTPSCRRCPNWKPVFDFQGLAAKAAQAALDGNHQYRLSG